MWTSLTSQGGWDENVSSIFLNDSVNELLSSGPASQQAYTALELRHEWHRVPNKIPPFNCSVPHLPTCKFPAKHQEKHALNNIPYITLLTLTIHINNAATLLIEILSEKLVHTGVFHVNTTVWGNKTLKKNLKTEANNEDALYSLVFIQSGTTMHNHCCLVCNLTSFLQCSSVMQYVFLKTAQGHFLFIMLWLNSQERKYKNTQCTKKSNTDLTTTLSALDVFMFLQCKKIMENKCECLWSLFLSIETRIKKRFHRKHYKYLYSRIPGVFLTVIDCLLLF